jgi:hypothetical protein
VFKGACYLKKNSCTEGVNPTKKFNFLVTSHFKSASTLTQKTHRHKERNKQADISLKISGEFPNLAL